MGVHWDTQHLGCDSVGIITQRSISPNTISCVPKDENMVTKKYIHNIFVKSAPIMKIIVCTSAVRVSECIYYRVNCILYSAYFAQKMWSSNCIAYGNTGNLNYSSLMTEICFKPH